MTVRLLERDAELRRLQETLRHAAQGRGSVVLVSGEAGIGKTSLVRAFAEHARAQARVLVGVCDDLVTPRTLGPFRDMARGGGGPLAEAAASAAERDAVFGAVYQELADRSTVMIVEDVHWADDATLDVVRYLAWRIAELPSVLLLTYRDDELRDDHPLRRVLGALARQDVQRLALRRLSPGAVQELATPYGADARAVLHATGGNPFFVTEVLASPDADVPATVRDAVLARLGQLGDDTQRSLELLSTIPGQVERWLVDALLGDRAAALDEAERRGVLEADPTHVWFRHELARRAILRRLSSTARVAYNRRVLAALARRPRVELSRLAHHAHEAGEPEQVVEHGLAAAREAAAAGAFHEALAHYELVLRWSGLLSDEQRAAIMEDSVWVLYNLSRFDRAVARAREVVRLRERLGDPAALGQALTTLSRTLYMVNDPAGSEEAVTRAVALLEPLGDRPRLARACTYLAAILKLTDRLDEAIAWARRALELGERTGQQDVVAHSLNYLGYALLDRGDPGGAEDLRRAVTIARAAHHYEYAQRSYTNLVEGLYRQGRFDELDEPIALGLAYAREYGFASHEYNLEAHRCSCSRCGGGGRRRRPGCGACWPARTPACWPASACPRSAGCWPAKGTRPPGRCWSGRGRRPPAPTPCRPSRWPASRGWRRPGWPATTGPPVTSPSCRWSAPRCAAPNATAASCCACWCAAASRRAASPAAPRSTRSASRATGAAPWRCGGRSALPTSRRWSWRPPAARRSCWRRCGRWTASAPWPPPTSCGSSSGGWASPACRAGPGQPRAPTPPGSPAASSRCSGCSPTGSPTPRSPTGWWCRSAPSTITSPPSSASSTSPRGGRRPAPTPWSAEIGTAHPPG
jgi:tetratricopeptide (TPR) repeat protein